LVLSERVPPGWGLLEAVENERLELRIQPRFYSITNGLDWLERICKNSTIRWLKTVGAIVAGGDGAIPKIEELLGPQKTEDLGPAPSDLDSEIGRAEASACRERNEDAMRIGPG
jgi:hypothetical protein